jgi:diguanylate cyclase (GGDEF)-like protein/PAS domain S-box-containing protein
LEQRTLAAVCTAIPDAIVVVSADGLVKWANEAAEGIFGFRAQAAIGTNALELLHPDDLEMATLALTSIQGRSIGSPIEVRVRTAEGWKLVEIIGANGLADPAIEGLVISFRDLTHRRRWELVSGEAGRLRSLVHNAASIFLLLDSDGHVLSASGAITRLLGHDQEVLEGAALSEIVHPDDAALLVSSIERVASGPIGSRGAVTVIIRMLRREGEASVPFELCLVNLLDDPTVAGVVVTGHDVSELKATQAALQELATRDSLTGLFNRAEIVRHADEMLSGIDRAGAGAAVLLMDVDRFKEVNDSLGHDAGDRVLTELAARLRGCVRETDRVGRLGGDEFAIVVSRCKKSQCARLAQRIAAEFDRPVEIEGKVLYVSVSIGIAEAPLHGADFATLMKKADIAMYRAKRERLGHAFYDHEDDGNHLEQLALGAELRSAIDHDALSVAYQPVVDLRTGVTVAVEALARWRNERLGEVSPGEFIPLAERVGLIKPLTERVLDLAMRDCARWTAEGFDLSVSVNLAPEVLAEHDLVKWVEAVLARHGVAPTRLTFEVVESGFANDVPRMVDNMRRLRRLGAKLSIDDFGTGYSSLARLRDLPLDEIKIDKSFVLDLVDDPRLQGLVRAVCQLASSLSLSVVAEGVENEETAAVLRNIGCELAQGFHLCRPMSAAAAMSWLASACSDGSENLPMAPV